MSMPEILEARPPGETTFDENGLQVPRAWSVLAGSDVEAIYKLRDQLGITRGSVFRDSKGVVPDPYLVAQRIRVSGKVPAVAGGLGLYTVAVDFANQSLGALKAKPGGPPIWTIRAGLVSTPVDIDGAGDPIVTSSGEPLEQPLSVLEPDEVLHADFYVAAADALTAYFPFRKFNGKVNDAYLSKLDAKRGSLLCHVFQPEASDTGWVKMSIDFQFHEAQIVNDVEYEGWMDVVIDKGRRKLVDALATAEKQVQLMLDASSNPLMHPVLLDGNGQPLAAGLNPVPRSVMNYRYADFSSIPFPK